MSPSATFSEIKILEDYSSDTSGPLSKSVEHSNLEEENEWFLVPDAQEDWIMLDSSSDRLPEVVFEPTLLKFYKEKELEAQRQTQTSSLSLSSQESSEDSSSSSFIDEVISKPLYDSSSSQLYSSASSSLSNSIVNSIQKNN